MDDISIEEETQKIKARYEKRKKSGLANLYKLENTYPFLCLQEKLSLFRKYSLIDNNTSLSQKRILEIGCGNGINLLLLIILGANPSNLFANELLEERTKTARLLLPANVRVFEGDAMSLDLVPSSFDVVLQSTVFSSILDDEYQNCLANKMWSLLKPGGGVLWYDFIYSNPNNHDVRGIKRKRINELFPEGSVQFWRVTLAPIIGRRIVSIWPGLYYIFNAFPFFKTHIFAWIKKLDLV